MYVKEDKDGNSVIVISQDLKNADVTGYVQGDTRTTFFTRGGSFRTRHIEEDEADSFALSLLVVVAMSVSIALALLSKDPRNLPGLMIAFGFGCYVVIGGGLGSERFHWKQGFVLAVAAGLLEHAPSLRTGSTLLTLTFATVILIGHIVSWKQQAVWEPFMGTALFLALLLANRFGFVPDPLSALMFCFVALTSFVWMVSVWASAETYRRGRRNTREY